MTDDCCASGWPDLILASAMAALAISGGYQVFRQAKPELRTAAT